MLRKILFAALIMFAMVEFSDSEIDTMHMPTKQSVSPTSVQASAALETREPISQNITKPWRSDEMLAGRFHPECPDDLQVIIHDGGPRFSDKTAEVIWVTVIGIHGKAYRGRILNQPHGLQSMKKGDEILFLAEADAEYPFQVSAKYLAERDEWVIEPCDKCGFADLFDAPSDLIAKVFPNFNKKPNEQIRAFTSFCPLCGGVQFVHKPGWEDE